jgi:DNA-binding transcriptional ArsR family regulator
VSVEAISWALNHAPVDNPTSKLVLLALANHARPDGSSAFPSVKTICRYTLLSERSVRTHLDKLEQGGVIRRCDPAIVAAYIDRPDRRPVGFDLLIGVQELHVGKVRGADKAPNGVQVVQERGAPVAPKPLSKPLEETVIMSEVVLETNNVWLEAERLCNLLSELIVLNGSKRPIVTDKWISEMEKLIRLDSRTPQQVENCIKWSQSHGFWRTVILSPNKLRTKYDQMRLQAEGERRNKSASGIQEFLNGES